MARPLALALILTLAACGGGNSAPDGAAEEDPAVTGALSGPLMSDPDLAAGNNDGAALGAGGPASAQIPLELRGAEMVRAAQAEADKLLGGKLLDLPDPGTSTHDQSRAELSGTAVALAAKAGGASAQCTAAMRYGFVWAARMPAALPVYPRAGVQEAAGAAEAVCDVRAVVFTTAVPVEPVLAFYYTAARKAGMTARYALKGEDRVIEGQRGSGKFVLFARRRDDGISEFELVTNGL